MKAGLLQVGSRRWSEGGVRASPVIGVTYEPAWHNTVVPTEGTIENTETNVAIKITTTTNRAPKEVCVLNICEDLQSTHSRGEPAAGPGLRTSAVEATCTQPSRYHVRRLV